MGCEVCIQQQQQQNNQTIEQSNSSVTHLRNQLQSRAHLIPHKHTETKHLLLRTDTMSSTSTSSQHKNYSPTQSMANPGMNYWVRSNPTQSTRRNAAGRGLFSGLQDTKHYNVDGGWAGRHVVDEDVHGGNSSLLGWFSGYVFSPSPSFSFLQVGEEADMR